MEFDNSDSADKVVGFGELKVNGEARPVFYARPTQVGRKPLIASRKLHVTGVPPGMAIEELQALLGNCQISLPKNNKDFMFATFVDERCKNEALFKLNGRKMDDTHVLKLSPAINTSFAPRDREKTGGSTGGSFGGNFSGRERSEGSKGTDSPVSTRATPSSTSKGSSGENLSDTPISKK